jgi:Na+/proline symporter
MTGAVKLGVAYGVVSLIARWVTGNTILSSPETLMKYGLTGVVGYSLMGSLGLILFGLLAKKIRAASDEHHTIGDFLHAKLSIAGYWYMVTILMITSLYSLFIQVMGAGILLHLIYPVPVFYGLFIFLAICFVTSGIGGMGWLSRMAGVNVTIIFGAVIIIPVYYFIHEGVDPVYEGIKLFHPYLLFYKNYDAVWFIFTAILIGFGQVLIDCATWQRVYIIRKEKVRATFTLAGLIWATIPLALSTLVMIVLFGGGFKNIYTLMFELINELQSSFLIVLFVLFCLSTISSATSSELHAVAVLGVRNMIQLFRMLTEKEKWNWTYLMTGTICLVLLVIVSSLSPDPMELLFFFGNIYAAIIIPMIYIILSKGSVPNTISFASLAGIAGGFLVIPLIGSMQSIWVSFALPGLVCLFYRIYVLLFNRRRVYQE